MTHMKESSSKVSVVIPFFRPGERLRSTLSSIVESTHRHIEVLMIDDAGGDVGEHIAREFAAKDSRFLYLRNDVNRGVSPARNRGIEAASGDFFVFIDSDDRFSPEWITGLLQAAQDQHADIVIGNAMRESSCGVEPYPMPGLKRPGFIDFRSIVFKDNAVVWNKLYSAALVQRHHLRFEPTLNIGEDLLFNYLVMRTARSIYYADHGYYTYYANHPDSIMRTSDANERLLNFIRLFRLLVAYDQQSGFKRHPKVLKKVAKDILRSYYAGGKNTTLDPDIRRSIRRLDPLLPERVRIHTWRKARKSQIDPTH